MQQHIHDVIGVEVSNATICRILGKHGFTRKKIRQVAQQRCTELRARFRAEMSFFSVVWVDETGCDKKSAIRKAGYALRGITPEYHRKLVKGRRLSSVAAIAVDGVVAVDFTHDSMNASMSLLEDHSFQTSFRLMARIPSQLSSWTTAQYIMWTVLNNSFVMQAY